MSELTRAAEVNNFYGAAFRVAEQNIFRLQIAVNDTELWSGEK